MKRICFCAYVALALCLFCLFSCTQTDRLYDVVFSAVASDKSLPTGQILCYGKLYENSASDDFLCDYLGLAGYPEFKDKIEDLAIYSSLREPICELAIMRLYRSSDAQDGALFFERRIKEARRALAFSGREGYAESGYVKITGNLVMLFMMPDNALAERAVG